MKLFQKNQIMKIFSYSLLFLILFSFGCGKQKNRLPEVSSGKIVRIENFKSKYISSKTVDVWLPDEYNNSEKYAVIYMNDGQMLFDSTVTWNKQEWQVDETLTSLIKTERIKECIVVGVFNNPELRMAEYFPQVALNGLLEPARSTIVKTMLGGKPLSDDYLKFLVTELKPLIDSTYSTITGPDGTFIMGSSMGGLISLYALCSYPDVFGGAACMSTHWPLVGPGLLYQPKVIKDLSGAFRDYLGGKLPSLHNKKIYFDYGTGTLDSIYKPYQEKVDLIMGMEGFTSSNWETKEFAGHSHDERSWAKRLSIPVEFFFGK
jgi:hypothetical protein